MNTQFKTIVSLLAAFLVFIFLFSGFIYYSIINYSNDSFLKLLEIKALTASKTLENLGENNLNTLNEIRSEFFDDLPNRKEYIIDLSQEDVIEKATTQYQLPGFFLSEILESGKESFVKNNLFHLGIKTKINDKEFIIIAAAENISGKNQALFLRRVLLSSIVFFFFISLIIAYYYSKYVFKPIKRITDRVKEISSENLHLRLHSQERNEELRELVNTFNDMLDRIETSFETQNNFISNASHELRTPLTAIIGEADVALSKIRSPEEYIETLKVILYEAEKLDAKTKALLFLAQTGFNGKVQKFDKVRIDQLLWDVKETIEKLTPKSRLHIDMELLPDNPVKLKVRGNEQLLHLALSNIISNACKYSGNKVVNISIGASDDKIFIIVKDKGIGIPEEELRYIYDPFFRASNTKNYEGYGIGLPLTQNIIRMHNGEIQVTSILNQGTTVQIMLPIGNYQIE